jgi:N-acetylmuramoyl-L-alanine amidase
MVLHKAYMPRVLVEMGFISNYVEGNLLDSESGQNEIATAANAIISYKNEYYGTGVVENLLGLRKGMLSAKDSATPSKKIKYRIC